MKLFNYFVKSFEIFNFIFFLLMQFLLFLLLLQRHGPIKDIPSLLDIRLEIHRKEPQPFKLDLILIFQSYKI